MELNWMANQTGLVVAFICLLVFGFFYNQLVERFQKRTQRYTAELVVGGVLVTVFTSALFIGLENALIVLMMFSASGFFMTIGSWMRAARDDEQAKQIQRDTNK